MAEGRVKCFDCDRCTYVDEKEEKCDVSCSLNGNFTVANWAADLLSCDDFVERETEEKESRGDPNVCVILTGGISFNTYVKDIDCLMSGGIDDFLRKLNSSTSFLVTSDFIVRSKEIIAIQRL